jgi:hypothetical protein
LSYDIYLKDPTTGETIELDEPHQLRGGTYCVGGTTEATLNVTYNYAKHYYRVMGEKGIRGIYGLTGEQSIPCAGDRRRSAGRRPEAATTGQPTEGNAREALMDLLALARMAPHGIWDGD